MVSSVRTDVVLAQIHEDNEESALGEVPSGTMQSSGDGTSLRSTGDVVGQSADAGASSRAATRQEKAEGLHAAVGRGERAVTAERVLRSAGTASSSMPPSARGEWFGCRGTVVSFGWSFH